jgi:carbamoyl-phosphate synthase large subunit
MTGGGATRVLVTAVGGDFGQAVIKALRLSEVPLEIHGCDPDPLAIGQAFVDGYAPVPFAHDASYLDAIDRTCRAHQLDAVIPASEPEIAVLGALEPVMRLPCGAAVVCQPKSWVDRFGDKLLAMTALQPHVALAPFADGADTGAVARLRASAGFPLVVKTRRGSGSRGVAVVNDEKALANAVARMPISVVQGWISDEGGEFSVGLYVSADGDAAIAFRRELGLIGCSWYAETVDDSEVIDYARAVARASGLRGAANVQVRKTRDGVRLLEINPRFSSLVAARAISGFRDAEWALVEALGSAPVLAARYQRIRFRRFFHELVDLGDGFGAVKEWQPRTRRATSKSSS